MIRKGGTDGDPVFRGMAASRVNILLDGEQVLGGCGMRMDPPTAYVFPEAYDRIVVIKGPQTVLHGPGNSAAAVSFERDMQRFEQTGYTARASALGASFGRNDLVGDLRAGTPTGLRAADRHARRIGRLRGRRRRDRAFRVRALERQRGARLDAGRPHASSSSRGVRSDGEAAYADRAMDGVKFDRENVGLSFEREDLTERVTRLEARGYYNYVDHVMDNFSLRDFTPTATMPGKAVQNPDRRTTGGRLAFDLALARAATATVGSRPAAERALAARDDEPGHAALPAACRASTTRGSAASACSAS